MADNEEICTVYVGNLDEKVSERVIYDILIQAGPVVKLCMPREKGSDKHRGFAFAQYETPKIANYAVKLFSGLVILCKKTLKFDICCTKKPLTNMPTSNSCPKPTPHHHPPPRSTRSDIGNSKNFCRNLIGQFGPDLHGNYFSCSGLDRSYSHVDPRVNPRVSYKIR